MLLILAFYYLTTSNATPIPSLVEQDTSSPSSSDNLPTRTLFDIVWGCLTTIFACTWLAVHPNIPEPVEEERNTGFRKKLRRRFRRFVSKKLPIFIMALLLPEYILAWAIRQRLVANKIVEIGGDKGWTRAQAFWIIMGGYHVYERGSDLKVNHDEEIDDDTYEEGPDPRNKRKYDSGELEAADIPPYDGPGKPRYALRKYPALWLLKRRRIELPTKEEIKDKSKTDGLAKVIVLLQTFWFLVQFIARRTQNLQVTELEVITLAYTTMSLWIYLVWWDKPRNVECPTRVYLTENENELLKPCNSENKGLGFIDLLEFVAGVQDHHSYEESLVKIPVYYSGNPTKADIVKSDVVTLVFATLFGGVHCIAWGFVFPSHAETLFWRISAVTMTVSPLVGSMLGIIVLSDLYGWHKNHTLSVFLGGLVLIFTLFLFLVGTLGYVLARLMSVALAFAELRSLTRTAYIGVMWTRFIPHLL